MNKDQDSALAIYAVRSSAGGVRAHSEPDDPLRGPFELDRHRIIESTTFRRLEGKTQVFAPGVHDHFRTRLTHTLEAATIARTLARALRANETLAEAIALAHDLGHPPFGHAGEAALAEIMADHGGFNHNAHSLRVVEYLEHPFPPFRGLNLTRDTLDGLRTHATRYDQPETQSQAAGFNPRRPANPARAASFSSRGQAEPSSVHNEDRTSRIAPGPSVEAGIASVADRVAYNCHDLEDAIGAELIALDVLRDLPIWKTAHDRAAADFPDRSIHALRRVVLDAMLNDMMLDIVDASSARLAAIDTPFTAQSLTAPLVAPSLSGDCTLNELEAFLSGAVYRHPEIQRTDHRGRRMVCGLFEAFLADPSGLPDRFARRIDDQGPHSVICDYIAGMTDRFCEAAFDRLAL